MHDKGGFVFSKDEFMEDTVDWSEFTRDRLHVGFLSNAALLRICMLAWAGTAGPWSGPRVLTISKHKRGNQPPGRQ
jgi:hypothetical protein